MTFLWQYFYIPIVQNVFFFRLLIIVASSEFVSSSIPSWQILTAHIQPFRGARDLAFCLKVRLDSLLIWASSGDSGETARMRRLAWTFAARIGDKYQIRLTRPNWYIFSLLSYFLFETSRSMTKPTKWLVHPVWSESSLCASWVGPKPASYGQRILWSDWASKPGLPGWSEFWRKGHFVGFVMLRLKYFCLHAFCEWTFHRKNIPVYCLVFFFLPVFFFFFCIVYNSFSTWTNWASSGHYGTYHLGDQRRLRRACASA